MKYFSMFSGIAGFELGIKNATKNKWECIGFSEINKYAIQIYKKHYGGHKNYGNAAKIKPEELPDFDMLCGGFPCQSFSIAGKRQGFQDTRGTLFYEICRIVAVKKPRFLLLENVKGLLSADNGRCFAAIISSLDELGYNIEWEVLNSKNFGVPQNRERVFIIGHSRRFSSRQVFPLGSNVKEINGISRQQTNTLTARYEKAQAIGSYIVECEQYAQKIELPVIDPRNYQGEKRKRVYDNISPTLMARARTDESPCIPVLTPNRLEKRQHGRRFKEDREEMFTLTGQDIHRVMKENRIRRLTPIECERLQGFPDNWTEGISDTQRYKCLGNAVTTSVIESIMEKLIQHKL